MYTSTDTPVLEIDFPANKGMDRDVSYQKPLGNGTKPAGATENPRDRGESIKGTMNG